MKIILTGPTGFIGSEILSQLLSHPAITSIVAISRRALPTPTTNSQKLQTVLLEDFNAPWPASVLAACAGAEACIWALGLATSDLEKNRVINRDYVLAGFHSLGKVARGEGQEHQGSQRGGRKRMKFVLMSAILAEKDQSKSLWFLGEGRKVRGTVETELLELGGGGVDERGERGALETYVVRPAYVQAKGTSAVMSAVVRAVVPRVGVEELAAASIGIAVHGGERRIWENGELVRRGRELLRG